MTSARSRWIAAAAAVVVVLLASLIVVTVLDAERNGRRALEQLQVEQLDQLTRSLDSQVASVFTALAGVVTPPYKFVASDPDDLARLNTLQALNPTARTGLILVDRHGTITAGTLLQTAAVGQPFDRPGLAKVWSTGHATILGVAPGLTTSLPTLAFVLPVLAPDGQVAGLFVAESEVAVGSGFDSQVATLHRGRTGEFSVVDGNGLVLASSDAQLLGRPFDGDPQFSTGPAGFRRVGGQVVAVGDIPSVGWRLIFRQDAGEFEGGLTGKLRSALFLLAITLVVGAGLVFFMLLRRLAAARQEQRRLAEINATREQFISIVSHELRTPVAGVLGFLQTTLDHWDSISDEERRRGVARASANARRLQTLARDVLDTSRIETGELPYSFVTADLRDELTESAAVIRDGHPQRHLHLDLPDHPVWVNADPDRILQVMLNLLDNALKNSPEESPIEVSVALTPDEVTVAVTDHGDGLSESELDVIFDKFAHGRSNVQGTGLGLYISDSIIQAHGGRMKAANADGRGAVVSFTLPRVSRPEPVVTSSDH